MIAPNRLAYRQTYPLGRGYSVEFVLDGPSLSVNWLPVMPPPKIGRKLLPRYRAQRNRFIASLGVRCVVIDL